MKTILALMWLFVIGMTNAVIELETERAQTAPYVLIALAWLCGGMVTVFFTMKDKNNERD